MEILFLPHALIRLKTRGISQDQVEAALNDPDETFGNEIGLVAHKIVTDPSSSENFLLRVFYQLSETGIEVISVYKTSKIEKYWKGIQSENKL